jgi:hypothetical protein
MVGDAVWVLDGATTPASVSSCCDKDARWYVHRLDAALTRQFEVRPELDLRRALAAAISQVQEEHAASCPNPAAGQGPSSTVAIVRRDGPWLDVLVLGDSTILLDHGDRLSIVTDTRLAAIAPELRLEIKTALRTGHGYADAAHERRRGKLVEAERLYRNRHGGYWIAADDPRAADHAVIARHAIGPTSPSVRRVLLMSDGAERAASLLGIYASNESLLAAAANGPEQCIRRIRTAEANDPTGRHHPRTKLSDDASLVVWEIEGALSQAGTAGWTDAATMPSET